MKLLYLEIPGEPHGKGRPRFTKAGHTYTPQTTRCYEEKVKMEYKIKYAGGMYYGRNIHPGGLYFSKNIPLEAEIIAYFSMPKNASKKRHTAMKRGLIRPTKKPDVDNIAKIVLDALNCLAYYDDSQVISCRIRKYYSEKPRVEVTIREVQTYDDQGSE